MKLNISKDACLAAAKREGDSEVGAGFELFPAPTFYRLKRDVPMSECHWLDRDFKAGEVVRRYIGPTYGVCGDGVACLVDNKAPFYEFPRDALEEIAR